MNIILVSWLESPLASKNPFSFQGEFCLRNKCRNPCGKVGFTQNLRNAEDWGPRQHLLCSLVFGHIFFRSPWMTGCRLHPLRIGRGFFWPSQKQASPNSRCSTGYGLNLRLCDYNQQKVVTLCKSMQEQKYQRQSHIWFTNTTCWYCYSGGAGVFKCICS